MDLPFLVDEDFSVADERRLHHAGGELLVAHVDVNRVAGRDAKGQAREPDRLRERRREGAARDLAFARAGFYLLVRAQHAAAVQQQQAQELARFALRAQRGLADEIALGGEIDRPRESRVERRDLLVHVLAVEVHAGLEAQRVARTQPAAPRTRT